MWTTYINSRNVGYHFSNCLTPKSKLIWIGVHVYRYSTKYIMFTTARANATQFLYVFVHFVRMRQPKWLFQWLNVDWFGRWLNFNIENETMNALFTNRCVNFDTSSIFVVVAKCTWENGCENDSQRHLLTTWMRFALEKWLKNALLGQTIPLFRRNKNCTIYATEKIELNLFFLGNISTTL